MDLPVWASTLIATAISTVVTTAVSLFVKHSIQKHLDAKDEQMKELEEFQHKQRKQERKDEMTEIVSESLKPIINRIDKVSDAVDKIQGDRKLERDATVVTMRVKMMELHDVYMERGYCDTHEKATWDELYKRYKALGGNHFLEYVDEYKKDIDKLPDSQRQKKSNKAKE